MKRRMIFTVALAVLALGAGSARAATPTVTEFNDGITTPATLYGITAGSDGRLWYVNQNHYSIGSINPLNGVSSEFSVGWPGISGITDGPDGNLYFGIENNAMGTSFIGNSTTSGLNNDGWYGGGSNAGPRFPTTGPDGRIWVTEHGSNTIGPIGLATPPAKPAIYPTGTAAATVPTPSAYPETIVPGPSDRSASPLGAVWFTEANGNKIARGVPLSAGGGPVSLSITEYAGLTTGAHPESIALGPDGNLWFTEFGKDKIGRLIPPSTFSGAATIQEFNLSAGATPFGIAAGADGNLWIAEQGLAKIARMNTSGVVTGEFPTTSGGPTLMTAGPDGNLWFTEYSGDHVGKVTTALDPPQFNDTTPIPIPNSGALSPPPTLNVSGLQGTVTGVTLRLTGISHTFPDDMDIILQGPQGQNVMVLSDVGSAIDSTTAGTKRSYPADGITLNLTDSAAREIPNVSPLVSGFYKPTNQLDPTESTTEGNAPGPFSTSFPSTLSTFNGTNPNGAWKLWVNDDHSGDSGNIYGGWGLDITTTGPPVNNTGTTTGTTTTTTAETGQRAAALKKCKKKKGAARKKCKKKANKLPF